MTNLDTILDALADALVEKIAARLPPGGQQQTYTIAQLTSMYDLLTAMKSEELMNEFYADGAALPHALNEGAMKTYSASKIKKNV